MRKGALLLASVVLTVLVVSGVALAASITCHVGADSCIGTEKTDTFHGTDQNDRMVGLGGGDQFEGRGGNDVAKGGPGPDENGNAPTTLGDDKFYGGADDDIIHDDAGRNVLSGEEGNDFLYGHGKLVGGRGDDGITGYARNYWINDEGPRGILGGPGNDYVSSRGTTNDTIYISDGERDTVKCGEGTDTVYFDKGVDKFVDNSGCENRVPK